MTGQQTETPADAPAATPLVPGWDEINQKPSGAGIAINTPQMPQSGVVEVHDTDDDILDGEKADGGTDAGSKG